MPDATMIGPGIGATIIAATMDITIMTAATIATTGAAEADGAARVASS